MTAGEVKSATGATKEVSGLIARALAWAEKHRKKRSAEYRAIADILDGTPRDLAKYYIEPGVQRLNPADHDEDGVRVDVPTPAFTYVEHFLAGDFKKSAGQHQLFVLADAGMGKSSLLAMLKMKEIKRNCVLIKLGPDLESKLEAVDRPDETLLLLDSLDEDPTAYGRVGERLEEVLPLSNPFRRVIITCRTQFFPADAEQPGWVKIAGYRCPSVYLSPFTDEQVERYLRKRFPRKATRWLWLRKDPRGEGAREVVPLMRSLRFRPMLLAHIEDLIGRDVSSEFAMFDSLVQAWLEREERKSRLRKDDPPIRAEPLAQACRHMAMAMQADGLRHIPAEELGKRCEQLPCLEEATRLRFRGRSLLNRASDGSYRFAHYSVQEFLVAYAILLREVGVAGVRSTAPIRGFLLQGWQPGGISLVGMDLDGMRAPCANLRRANLKYASLKVTNLAGATLEGAFLHEANLYGANLDGANLSEAKLGGAKLAGAYLIGADLAGANLEGANLAGANLEGANLEGADLAGANLEGANLEGAKLAGANLNGANLDGANLKGAKLERPKSKMAVRPRFKL